MHIAIRVFIFITTNCVQGQAMQKVVNMRIRCSGGSTRLTVLVYR